MVPRVTSKGRSFKGAGAYFLHDLGKAKTSERVEFTHTVNMLTDDPEKALKVMAWTAAHANDLKMVTGQKMTGRKAENPVYTYCLAWAPDQDPTQAEMTALGLRSMETLGVAHHEAVFVAHNDTPHKHLHVILNRVDPETGLLAKMSHDQNLLSRLAQSYEEETGRVYCAQRVENNRRRDLGERNVKATSTERLAETTDYQERRVARMQAQRAASAAAAARLAKDQAMERAARDFRAAFDTHAGRDDRLYRSRETERTLVEERREAGAASADERATQQAKAKAAQDQARIERQDRARQALREKLRRLKIDERRANEWAAYEAGKLQALNDRQTARREGLREIHAESLRRFDDQLAKKYALYEETLQRRIEDALTALHRRGARAVIDKVTGARKVKEARLTTLQAAVTNLAKQKLAERATYEARQRAQRDAQAKRHEEERQTLTKRLAATKARQDAKFEDQERPSHAFARASISRNAGTRAAERPAPAPNSGKDREPER